MTALYSLNTINQISQSGFYYEIPEDTCATINYLCSSLGIYGINSNVFVKQISVSANLNVNDNNNNVYKKKKRGNKSMEVTGDEWESIRTYETTKIEEKKGIEGDINEIRLYLNKLSDKTFLDIREKIIDKLNTMNLSDDESTEKVGTVLYELCSTNKFYSKIFASLFAELASTYKWVYTIFKSNYENLMDIYSNITYIDSDKDYNGFCEMNKTNEKRRAITMFYYNLGLNGFIKKKKILKLLQNIIELIFNLIDVSDKKNEVDELTEIVAILYNKELLDIVENNEKYFVANKSIIEIVSNFAQKKVKDHPSLSNKAIFKYMDLVDM